MQIFEKRGLLDGKTDLEEANLLKANITGANLSQADLEKAIMPDGTTRRR